MMEQQKVTICTFNCSGFQNNKDYIKDLLEKEDCDILLLQETWLLESNLCLLNSLHSGYQCVGKSGVENNTEILVGRPPGGTAIYWKKINLRLQNDFNVLIANVYMPCM